MKITIAATSLVLMTAAFTQTAHAGPADRSGFTANLSLGLGVTNIAPEEGDGDTKVGLAGLNLDLGAYIMPNLAVLFRLSGTSFSQDIGTSSEQFVHGFYGVAGQLWLDEKISVGGGVGLGVFGLSPFSDLEVDSETGLALNARGSYRFAGGWHGSLDLTPGFYDSAIVTSVSFLAGYQWD